MSSLCRQGSRIIQLDSHLRGNDKSKNKLNNMKKLNVPFYAQREIVSDDEKDGACGIVCVKMILDFFFDTEFDVHDLLKEGYIVGGKSNKEWNHETLVRVLRNHGIQSYRQEFISHDVLDFDLSRGELNQERTEQFIDFGIYKIKKSIDEGNPVMVSVKPGFGMNESSHIVLIVGYDDSNFYFNDSQRLSTNEHPLQFSIEDFKTYWKNFAIFVE